MVHPHVWRGIGVVRPARHPVVRPAEIVFGAGAADGGIRPVPVQVELDFSLAPPAAVAVDAHPQGRADVMSPALHAVQQGVHPALHRAGLPVLGVEIGRVLRHLGQGVVDLVIHDRILIAPVLHRDAAPLTERHFPKAVVSPVGGHQHRQGLQGGEPPGGAVLVLIRPEKGEKVGDRRFHRRPLLPVPVKAQEDVPPQGAADPKALDRPRPLDVGHRVGRPGWDDHRGGDLPALPDVAGKVGAGALHAHGRPPLFASGVLRADRPGSGGGETA